MWTAKSQDFQWLQIFSRRTRRLADEASHVMFVSAVLIISKVVVDLFVFWCIQLQQKLSKIRVTLGEFPCWRAVNDSLQNVILELWLLYTSSHNALSSSVTFLFAQISLCWLQHLLYLVFSWVISCNSGEYGSEVLN